MIPVKENIGTTHTPTTQRHRLNEFPGSEPIEIYKGLLFKRYMR